MTFRQASLDLMSTIAEVGGRARRSAVIVLGGWAERRRQRQALALLTENSEHLLRDIGVTREEASREAAKPFWR